MTVHHKLLQTLSIVRTPSRPVLSCGWPVRGPCGALDDEEDDDDDSAAGDHVTAASCRAIKFESSSQTVEG